LAGLGSLGAELYLGVFWLGGCSGWGVCRLLGWLLGCGVGDAVLGLLLLLLGLYCWAAGVLGGWLLWPGGLLGGGLAGRAGWAAVLGLGLLGWAGLLLLAGWGWGWAAWGLGWAVLPAAPGCLFGICLLGAGAGLLICRYLRWLYLAGWACGLLAAAGAVGRSACGCLGRCRLGLVGLLVLVWLLLLGLDLGLAIWAGAGLLWGWAGGLLGWLL